MSLINNTVRLKAEFRDFDGALVSPTNVVVNIYDGQRVQIGTSVSVTPVTTGVYQYDYTIPDTSVGPLYYEFKGTVGGKAILGRSELDRTWI